MLQTPSIPSSPLPEMPHALPGAGADGGDAGERAEFAQLLQQARSGDAEAAYDEPTVMTAKEARVEARARSGSARATQEPKPHDLRHRAEAKATDAKSTDAGAPDAEALDLAACLKQTPATDATAVPLEEAGKAVAEGEHAADAGADAALPALLVPVPPQPTATVPDSAPALPSAGGDERALRAAPRGARDLRLATHADAAATSTSDASAAGAKPSAGEAASPGAVDTAFDLALRETAGVRSAAPGLRSAAHDATPAVVPGLARELQLPLAAHAEAPAEASLHAAPDEPGFAPALGTQVALWVKDGVQEARLQLHPAELGPVTVQIALDGQAAHIDFTAAVATTRSSIEQSLPALAAALRESGFTLAGGGVFGRSGQGANDSHRERAPEGRGARGTAAIASGAGTDAAPPMRRWGRSLVDVYA